MNKMIIAALAVVAMVGCAKESNIEEPMVGDGTVTFSTTTRTDDDTQTQTYGKSAWRQAKISVSSRK